MASFVDPNRCDPNGNALELVELHNEESDWYAWWTMLFQSLFFIHPYGGVYKPTDKTKRIPVGIRGLPRHRISVYHPEVKYPLQARPLNEVPELLTNFFRLVFVDGLRPKPTEDLFDRISFRSDGSFDQTATQLPLPMAVPSAQHVRHSVLHDAQGLVLDVVKHDDGLQILEYADGQLWRNEETLLSLKWSDELSFHVSGSQQTAFALRTTAIIHGKEWARPVKAVLKIGIGGIQSMVAGTAHGTVFWDGSFKLLHGRKEPTIRVLDIDPELHPLGFWADGDRLFILSSRKGKLGFAIHHLAWDLTLCQSAHPFASPEEITAARGYANEHHVWLFLARGSEHHICDIFDGVGRLVNHFESDGQATADWMLRPDGKCQAGRFLFSPSEGGIVRLSVDHGKLDVVELPSDRRLHKSRLIVNDNGLLAVDRAARQILQLTVG